MQPVDATGFALKVLLLGGTGDARQLTKGLIEAKFTLVYSVKGFVRQPDLDCEGISGGFSQLGGLRHYLISQAIDIVVDATHPYATHMSSRALDACQALNKAYWRFERPQRQAAAEAHWVSVGPWQQVIHLIAVFTKPFLTTGQLGQTEIDQISRLCTQIVYRTAAPASANLADNVQWMKAIGPFAMADELALLRYLGVDVLVCKNSGGESTYANLLAAREINLPVIMLERPDNSSLSRLKKSIDLAEESKSNVHFFSKIDTLLQSVIAFAK
jgi:precorrin-6A/cobalt-precorrin-6A reductase